MTVRNRLLHLDLRITDDVWTSRHPPRLLRRIGDLGPRPTGSSSFREAQKIVGAALRRIGATNVHTEPVPVLAWSERGADLRLTAPRRRTYDACQHVHTAPADVRGPLVSLPALDEASIDRVGRRLEGAIILISGPGIRGAAHRPLPILARDLARRGAAGLITYNAFAHQGPDQRHLAVTDPLPIPAVGVSHDTGRALLDQATGNRARVRVSTEGRSYRGRCSNLIADLGPSRRTDQVIVLNAHLDSLPIAPGALDNLSGVLTLIEIARALAPHRARFRRTLRLLVPTGEEYGLVGSAHYVRQRRERDELDQIVFDFSLDTLFPGTSQGIAVMWAAATRDLIDRLMRQAGRDCDVRNLFCQGSDYLPFMLAGIPAARAADWTNALPPVCHTTVDDVAHLPVEWIRMNAMPFAQLLLRLLIAERPPPDRRKSPAEVAALIEHHDLAETARLMQLFD